jgi:hypothetical protein
VRTYPTLNVKKAATIDSWSSPVIYAVTVTREEIEKRMDDLASEFAETHNPEIPEEIYRSARQPVRKTESLN